MRMGALTDRRGYLHEAVLYDSDEEFLGVVLPFLQEGVAAGEPCFRPDSFPLATVRPDPIAPGTFQADPPRRDTPQPGIPQLDATTIEDLVFAVSEAVTNAVTHGRPPIRVRLWTAPDRIVATVTDRGDGPADPFVGLLPVTNTSSGELGLWLTHQLCNHVTLDTTDEGFTIRLVVGTPQPGRSADASDAA